MMLREGEVIGTVRRLQLRELRAWVRAGWIRPAQGDDEPLFDEMDIARLRLICDLRKEMALPAGSVPVILSLLDQVHGLRRELHTLVNAIDQQPEEVRRAVLDAYTRRSGQ